MEPLDFTRCRALNTIPANKLTDIIASLQRDASLTRENRTTKLIGVNRYADSNIPIEYWFLNMDKDFTGDERLKTRYQTYIANLDASYTAGQTICFAGGHGLGKTFTSTAILKKAAQKGFSCLYTTFSDIVSVLTQGSSEDKFAARRELVMIDFLAIDEVDNRFFKASDAANETFARTLEFVLRSRLQNKLPTLMATNSPQIKETFVSHFKDSLGSLMNKVEMFVIMPGNDFRKEAK